MSSDGKPPDDEEGRTNLSVRLSAATSDLNAFVGQLRAEVDKGTDGTTMMDKAPESRDELRNAAIKDIAAIKAGDLLESQAATAASLLNTQADTASSLLAHQAGVLNDSVTGLRDAVLNLEHRMILTEERASMSEERANLTDKRADQKSHPAVALAALVAVAVALGLLVYKQIDTANQLQTQQTEICVLYANLHQTTPNCQ